MGDHYEVLFNHALVISKDNAVNNFRQYLQAIEQEFNQELTKTLFSMITKEQNANN